MSSYCEIYIVRHGETDWNVEERLQGHTDIPLNDNGKNQAKLLQEKLQHVSFAAAFTSDLARALHTAEIVLEAKKIALEATEALREVCMADWEGKLVKELNDWRETQEWHPASREDFLSTDLGCLAESYSQAFKRFISFALAQAANFQGQTLLFSSHGGLLASILYHLSPEEKCAKWKVDNCGFLKLRVCPEGSISLVEYQGVNKQVGFFSQY